MLKFIYRLIKHLGILLFISLPLELAGIFILSIVVPYVSLKGQEKLPRAFKWFDSFDLYSDRDRSVYRSIIAQGPFKQYCWLALRNPLNYFGYVVLGFKFNRGELYYYGQGDINVGDSAGKGPGLLIMELRNRTTETTEAYEYYFIHRWSATKCFRFRLGYKIGLSNQDGMYIQQVLVCQLYKSYSGT